MKRIIDIPESAFNSCKSWVKLGVATWQDTLIANSIPYEEGAQGEWIPVSERLPDFWESVLVTDESGNVFEYERRPLDDNENVCREWSFLGRKIIAWMPEPEPYQKGGAE